MLKKIYFTIVLLMVSLSAFASDFTVHKLQNGQTLVVQEVKTNPIVTIDTWVKTGSLNENDSNNGVSHFLEHLFFKGTKAHPTGEFDRILESKGAIINAATSKDFTHYYITLPSEYFEKALDLHADMLQNPMIPRKELEMERKVVLEEIAKDGNTPSQLAYDNLNSLMYINHPYKRKVIGAADIVSTIRREEILDYFNKYYVPSNMTTLVVGDVDTQNVIKKVTEAFDSNCKKVTKSAHKKEHQLFTQRRKTDYVDANTGYIMIGFRGVPISSNEVYALDILAQVLGVGKSSRYYRNIKEQKGLAYTISADNTAYKEDGIIYISASFNPLNAEKLEKSIFDEITNIQKYGITEEELITAKKIIEQDTYYARESTSDIATNIGYIMTLTDSADLYKNYLANIDKVTLNDVQNVAKKYLGVNKSAVSTVLPKNETIEAPAIKQHTAQKINEADGITKYILDNNSTLLINKHQNNDIVAISVMAKGGEFLEKKIGEGTMAASAMLSGTKKYSAQELAILTEENGIKIKPVCNSDLFSINIQTTAAQLNLTLNILDELLNNALYEDYEVEKKRNEILGKIKQKRDIPVNIALENYKTLIFENSVYSNSNNIMEKALPKLTVSDIKAYYNRIFDSKNIIISINGNVDENVIIQSFGEMLKDKKQPIFNYSNYKIPKLNTPKKSTETIKDLQTAWLFIGWQTCGIDNKRDFVTLKLLDTLLGSGLSSRIYRNLREQDGLAYQLGSQYSPKKLGGNFLTYIGTSPNNVEYSKNKLMKEIERLKIEFVSDQELSNAKERLKGGFIVTLETNSEKASVVGGFETLGLGYNFLKEYTDMIDTITASDIISVANKYFTNISVESIIK
ncbi:MAG: insulinase family protein [bacterium]|nr:insulinase family protein [bacterium]